jgi:GNAT superfamily N-acetyltransferase
VTWAFRSEPLGEQDRSSFSCGNALLDGYLHECAHQDRERNLAAPFVLVEEATGAIVGYYTLSSRSLNPTRLPRSLTRKLPRYAELPAILIGRLAVDRRYQGGGFGRRIVYDALQRCLQLSRQLGAFAVVVDAKDREASDFYEHLGFLRFEDHDLQLYIPVASVSNLLASTAIEEQAARIE